MDLYEPMQKIRKLDRPPTPHITPGYYNINGFSQDSVKRLKATVRELNRGLCDFKTELSTKNYTIKNSSA